MFQQPIQSVWSITRVSQALCAPCSKQKYYFCYPVTTLSNHVRGLHREAVLSAHSQPCSWKFNADWKLRDRRRRWFQHSPERLTQNPAKHCGWKRTAEEQKKGKNLFAIKKWLAKPCVYNGVAIGSLGKHVATRRERRRGLTAKQTGITHSARDAPPSKYQTWKSGCVWDHFSKM